LQIDANSTLISRQGSIVSIQVENKASVVNAGTIDLSSGNDAPGRLTLQGDYTGNNGTLRLNSVLAGDDASDRLVVSRGHGGSTQMFINNFKGAGAATTQRHPGGRSPRWRYQHGHRIRADPDAFGRCLRLPVVQRGRDGR
jgi:type V secretory pathway adhesin AidA